MNDYLVTVLWYDMTCTTQIQTCGSCRNNIVLVYFQYSRHMVEWYISWTETFHSHCRYATSKLQTRQRRKLTRHLRSITVWQVCTRLSIRLDTQNCREGTNRIISVSDLFSQLLNYISHALTIEAEDNETNNFGFANEKKDCNYLEKLRFSLSVYQRHFASPKVSHGQFSLSSTGKNRVRCM